MATGFAGWSVVAISVIGPLAFAAGPATAKCAQDGMTVVTSVDVALPTNPRIVVEHWGPAAVEGRPPWPAMELRAGAQRVRLSVVERYDGARNVTEAVLAPATELRPRTRYALYFADGGKPVVSLAEPVAWTTGASADRVPPRWLAPPRAGVGESKKL